MTLLKRFWFESWVKKEGGSFDVSTYWHLYEKNTIQKRCVCQRIGIYMLYLKGKKYDSKNIELQKDGGLTALKNLSGPASEKMKQLQSFFKQKGLQIIIECNLKVVRYHGVILI